GSCTGASTSRRPGSSRSREKPTRSSPIACSGGAGASTPSSWRRPGGSPRSWGASAGSGRSKRPSSGRAPGIARAGGGVGPAGSGKSRLVYEFHRRHDGEPVTFFEGRCVAIDQAIPFYPLIHMFRRHFGIRPGDTLDEALERVRCHERDSHGKVMEDSAVERMLTGFLVDPTRAPSNVPADEVKRLVFDAVEHGIRGHAERGPTVIVVEDYHFIDEVSQELIEHLARRLHDCRVLLLVTHRPKDGMEGPKKAGIIPVALERMAD